MAEIPIPSIVPAKASKWNLVKMNERVAKLVESKKQCCLNTCKHVHSLPCVLCLEKYNCKEQESICTRGMQTQTTKDKGQTVPKLVKLGLKKPIKPVKLRA